MEIPENIPKLIPAEFIDERYREIAELARKKHECELNKDYLGAARLAVKIIKLRKQIEGGKENDMR
jgi:hypothetical protein